MLDTLAYKVLVCLQAKSASSPRNVCASSS